MTDFEMPDMNWYDRDGNVISEVDMLGLVMDPAYPRIGRTEILDEDHPTVSVLVMTSWIGRSLASPGSEPLIFETLVFDTRVDKGNTEVASGRYTTEQEARDGHADMVAGLVAAMSRGRTRDYA